MLNLKERQNVLVCLRCFCTVNRFPVQVDVQDWRLSPGAGSKWKELLSKAWYFLFILHTVYKVLTLVQVLLFIPGTPLYQIILHAVMAAVCAMIAFWYYILYIKHAVIFAIVMRSTLTGNITTAGKQKFYQNIKTAKGIIPRMHVRGD